MITIDPNLRGCGVAVWGSEGLVRADYVVNPDRSGRGYETYTSMAVKVGHYLAPVSFGPVLIEMPRIYGSVHEKGDPNDTLDVLGVGAAVALALRNYGPVQHVFPSEWKGTLKKKAMLERIWSKLTLHEQKQIQQTNKADTEDILDAVGIGLWKLGRLNRKNYPGAI